MPSVIFDMDGVLYRGTDTLPGGSACINRIRKAGFKTGFLTNNAGHHRREYTEILAAHGIEASLNDIMTSGEATAKYLVSEGHKGKRVYIVGSAGLAATLESAGMEVDVEAEGDPVDFVVVGWDRNISFNKIARAQWEIQKNDAVFIATNVDALYPAKGNRNLPGAGTMVAAVATAADTSPLIIGKPETRSLQFLLEELGNVDEPPEFTWVVGDRLDTDIACGNTYGSNTVLVTTGISTREDAESADEYKKPDYIIDSLFELPALLDLSDDGIT